MDIGKVDISVVIPAHNEEANIESCYRRVAGVLAEYGKSFEVILEQDGSTDKTPQIIDRIAKKYPNVVALHESERYGKGFGIRKAMDAANGKLLAFIDADLEYPPESFPAMFKQVELYDIVVGVKDRATENRWSRIFLSRLHNIVLQLLFKIDLEGSQSGLKVFRREAFQAVQPLSSNGFEVDSEILVKAIKKGYSVCCLSVKYHYKGSSQVNLLIDPVKMFLGLLKLRARLDS